MKTILAVAAGFALLSSAAFAQDAAPASDFATLDADASGDVTLAEANTIWPDLTAELYAAADTNGDGKVDQAEYDVFLAANPLP
jgi:opacity protein-like surface antigen